MSVTLTVEQGNHTAPSAPHYDVAVSDGAHGSVTVSPKSASKGSTVTVTVTPDKGYALETLTVTDKNGSALDLTDQGGGKYTFTMPSSPVTVAATFMDDNTMLNFFVDVPAGAYYYDAVLWATEGGIVTGTDAVHFSPAASARTTSSRASRSRRCSTASPRRREWTRRRVAWPRASLRISSYLEAKEPEFRRRILSSPRFRNHSHMLTPTHQPKRSQLRRYSVEKQSPFS